MREIKFRAWNIVHNLMYYRGEGQSNASFFGDCPESVYKLMQFTELKDKNGKEIYEGDIIKHNPKGSSYFVVKSFILDTYTLWKMIALRLNNPGTKYTKIEVIGNIYENPELLEEKQ